MYGMLFVIGLLISQEIKRPMKLFAIYSLSESLQKGSRRMPFSLEWSYIYFKAGTFFGSRCTHINTRKKIFAFFSPSTPSLPTAALWFLASGSPKLCCRQLCWWKEKKKGTKSGKIQYLNVEGSDIHHNQMRWDFLCREKSSTSKF